MKKMILPVILVMLASNSGVGQEVQKEVLDQDTIFARLSKNIDFDDLSDAVKAGTEEQDEEFVRAWTTMIDATDILREASEKQKNIPVEYRRSLMDVVEALERVKKKDLTTGQKLKLCNHIAQDLNIKSKYVEMGGSPFGPVNVTVHTRKGSHEVSNYVVWYAATSWKEGRKQRFLHFSSPTTEPLVPGEYYLWARMGTAEGEKSPVIIGRTLKDEEDVDIAVPN